MGGRQLPLRLLWLIAMLAMNINGNSAAAGEEDVLVG